MVVYPSKASGRVGDSSHSNLSYSHRHERQGNAWAGESSQSAYANHSINNCSPVKGALWSQHHLLRQITLCEGDIIQEDQSSDKTRSYIKAHFHRKECNKFVPKQIQPVFVTKVKELRCHCGEILEKHEAMTKHPDNMIGKNIIPQEFSELVNHPDNPIPVSLPTVPWDKTSCLTEDVTNAYGKLIFSVTMIGGMKPAKYVRLSDTDSVDKLIDCMVQCWRIMEPKPPSLVISVIGGAKNFQLDGRNRDTFHSGLIKAAKTTSAWLITSGFNMGVMKAVGQAVHKGQTLTWDNDRMAHNIRCIGIAPWGYVEDRQKLIADHTEDSPLVVLKANNCIQHNSPVPINPDHTHFVFVDDGMRNSYSGVASFRASFERKISLPTKGDEDTGLGIPVVIVVVEGGVDAIRAVMTSIEQGIPVVVCAGTGRAADILSYAYTHTVTTRSGHRYMKKKHMESVESKLYQAYGEKWVGKKGEEEMKDIKQLVLECCQQDNLITIFYMEKDEDLDLAILSALLKAKGTSNIEQRQNQLRLALTWDRCDIVQAQIFKEDVYWPPGSLDEIMTDALLQEDRVNFIQLLIQEGFTMKDYLTVNQLESLYNAIPQHCHLRKMLRFKSPSHSDVFTLIDVKRLLNQLLDLFNDSEYNHYAANSRAANGRLPGDQFSSPYRELFLWAVLMNRQNLAKLCWEMGEDTIASAVMATHLYLSMSKKVDGHEHVLKQIYINNKDEFELLATSVLNECHAADPDKAMMLVEKPSQYWCQITGLQMAAAANDQVFLSVSTCQNSINLIWKRGLLSSWRWIGCALACPFLIWPLIKLENEDVGFFRKAYLFYKAPITKFAANSVMYLLFLITYSYMILFDFKPYISNTEIICIIWIFTFLIDEIHCLVTFPTPTVIGKFRDWYGLLNRLDLLNLILVFIGFFLKLYPPYFTHAKAIYCLNCVSFFLRILKLYKANSFLGPKLYMIVRMVEELLLFVSILVVFLLAYGVSSQSLLWPRREPYWGIFKDIIYYPYWQIYGELFLDEIETDTACHSLYNSSSAMLNLIPCRTYSFLVPFLLAAYLLIGNLLLLNLLIAIFSHVFDEVQKNTLEIWKYQVYFLVMEYDIRTFLVPPFSIIEHVYRLIRFFVQKSNCRKTEFKSPMSRKQFQYLQIFEKEMMANFLRLQKAEELNSIDYKFLKIEKRVDEMTKLIEDELIADQQQYDWEATLISSAPRGTTPSTIQPDNEPGWPLPEDVKDLDDIIEDDTKTMENIVEGQIREVRKEKKRKRKKKHRRREDNEDSEKTGVDKVDLWHTSQNASHGRGPLAPPNLRKRRSNLSSRNVWMDDDEIGYNRHSHERVQAVWSDTEIDFNDMVPLESVSQRSSMK